MRVYVGNDHGGVSLRQPLLKWLGEHGHEVVATEGPAQSGESVDYPDIAAVVCRKVLADPGSYGLLVCGTGQGMAISANHVPGIRAALVSDVFSARMAREHNDANVVCMGERVLGPGLAVDLLAAFCAATFAGGRHARRVGKIEAIAAAGDGGPAAATRS
ncbi:MAG: ribose 5-phosphate isomerase B [Deltaproteobacteria bacterium]|nr:ribose 5-phosphate isomerase B [Deltaproteobacteria bacterium]